MPNWKKVIVSGSDAVLNSIKVTTNITASNISASGNLFANITDNSSTSFKTVVVDPSTGQLYRTGSYGGGGGGGTGNGFPFEGDALITGSLVISQSYTAGDTDSTALRLIGSGSVSQSGIFEVEGSAGPLFSVQDGLDGVLMEVNNITGLPLFQVSSSNEVFVNRGNLTSGVTTATASFAHFTGSFQGDGSQLTNLPASDPFPFTGDAQITGSLKITGSFEAQSGTSLLHFETGASTGSADGKLSITSTGGSANISLHRTDGKQAALLVGTNSVGIHYDETGKFAIGPANNPATASAFTTPTSFVMDSSGKVGINTNTPNARLAVVGKIKTSVGLESGAYITASSYIKAGSYIQTDSHITASGNISASGNLIGAGLTLPSFPTNRVPFIGSNGELTTDSGFEYNSTTDQLKVHSLDVVHLTSSFITASTVQTSGSNIFGDDTTDTQTLIGTTKMSGSAQITGSLTVTGAITSTNATSNLSGSFSGSFQGDGTNLNLANNTTISSGTNLTQSIFVTQNGDDTTGTIGNISKPFATLESASQAATTGSTIFVYPGTYTLGTDNLAREGVDYYFYPNTTVNQSNSTNIFDQNGFNLACNIYGSANFNITSTGGLVYFGTTNGFRDYDFTFQAQDINYSTGTAFSGMPKSNRIFSIDIRHSSGSGRFYHAPGNTAGSGRIDIKADTIESGNNNVFNTQGGINSIRIKANRIYTPNAVSIRTYNSSLDADVQYAVGDTYGYSFTDTHGGTNNIRGYTNGINHANPSKTVFNGIVGKLDISNGEFHGGVANNGTITGGESSFKWHTTYTDTFSISGGVTSIELADSSQYMGQLSVSGTAKVIVTGYKQGANSNFRYSISGGELIYKAHTLYPYNDNGANYAFDLSGGLLRMQGYIKNQLTDSDAQPQQSACIRYRGGELILDGATLIASSSVAPAIWVTDQDREVKIYSGGVNTNKTGSMGLLAASSSFGSGGYALTNPLGGMIIEDASVE